MLAFDKLVIARSCAALLFIAVAWSLASCGGGTSSPAESGEPNQLSFDELVISAGEERALIAEQVTIRTRFDVKGTLVLRIGNSVLPDYLWAVCGLFERLRRVAHRAGRAFVVSDARPSPWTTLRRLQRWTSHSQTCCDKSEPILEPACPGSHRAEQARQASRLSLAPTNSSDEAEIQTHFFAPKGPPARLSITH